MRIPILIAVCALTGLVRGRSALDYVDPLIGTEGSGSQYGGMMPYTCVPFGSFHLVPMTRAGLTSYLKRGYVACDETAESVSRTQDFSLADRNRAYTNLWCAAEGLFLPRRKDGSFMSRAELGRSYGDYTEQSPEAALWCVPHDPEGLAELMGGRDVAVRRLDDFFERLFWVPERGNKSIHGNEPSHHCAYLYNRFGAPERWRVKRVTLDGRELSNWRIRHDEIVKGGELVFEMKEDM